MHRFGDASEPRLPPILPSYSSLPRSSAHPTPKQNERKCKYIQCWSDFSGLDQPCFPFFIHKTIILFYNQSMQGHNVGQDAHLSKITSFIRHSSSGIIHVFPVSTQLKVLSDIPF